jgi:acetyltransferase EpsM
VLNLVGGGGHASVIADMARRARIPGIVLWVDTDPDLKRFPARTVWRPLDSLDPALPTMLAMGDLATRQRLRQRFANRAPAIVDLTAIVGHGVVIGAGTVVMPGCYINPNARIGVDCILNTGCIVEHDCVVGDNTHLSPGVRLAGAAEVGSDAHVGTGAIVLPGVKIGDRAIIGAGAVVVRNVPADVTAVGVPARIIKQVGTAAGGDLYPKPG